MRLQDTQEELRQVMKLRDSPQQLQRLISRGLITHDKNLMKGKMRTQIIIDAEQSGCGNQIIKVNRIQKLFVGFQPYQQQSLEGLP